MPSRSRFDSEPLITSRSRWILVMDYIAASSKERYAAVRATAQQIAGYVRTLNIDSGADIEIRIADKHVPIILEVFKFNGIPIYRPDKEE